MSHTFRHGLVVGKFSPLHRGHELLINRALAECCEVTVISYAKPEYAGCCAKRREHWLAELFPTARRLVIDDARLAALLPGRSLTVPHDDEPETVHRHFVGVLCREILAIAADAVFTSEEYGNGFAGELTRFFRGHDPNAKEVIHRLVDLERLEIPISGTRVRADLHGCRSFLSPQVYASFVKRICILGGESSGKSTLADALAQHFETVVVPEYGRELWVAKNGALKFEDMRIIADRQVQLEDAAVLQAKRYLFCDTSPLTTLLYSRHLFGSSELHLEKLAQRPYSLYVLCSHDIAFVQDGTRQEPGFREQQHVWYQEKLAQRGIEWCEVSGTVAERVDQVAAALLFCG